MILQAVRILLTPAHSVSSNGEVSHFCQADDIYSMVECLSAPTSARALSPLSEQERRFIILLIINQDDDNDGALSHFLIGLRPK